MESQRFVGRSEFERLKDRVGNGNADQSHSERITILETNQATLTRSLDGIRKQMWAVIMLLVTLLGGLAVAGLRAL